MRVVPATTTAPASLGPIAVGVAERIRRLLDAETARWARVDLALAEPLDTLLNLVMAGGKRLRPGFCYWAFVGAGGDPADPAIVDAGAASAAAAAGGEIGDIGEDGAGGPASPSPATA